MKQRAETDLKGALNPHMDAQACLPRAATSWSGHCKPALSRQVGRGPSTPDTRGAIA